MSPESPNTEQRKYWNEQGGSSWVALQERMDAQIRPIGLAALDRLAPAPGEAVLDIGCGCGDTTLEIASRVGASGSVLGVDLSEPMLARARERGQGYAQVEFRHADVQSADLGRERFDAAYSRFGVMFFEDPSAAFANVRGAQKRGGRLGFACWQEVRKNPFFLEPMAAVAGLVQMPPPAEPGAPGPFAFADPERVRGILDEAGYTEIEITPWTGDIDVGGTDDALEFYFEIGPLSRVLQEVSAGPDLLAKVRSAILEVLERHRGPDGIRMPVANWLVSARA